MFYVEPRQEWIEISRRLLAEVATKGETTTYGEHYDLLRVWFNSGALKLPARKTGREWMNHLAPILAGLGSLNKVNEEPALSCLVRNAQSGSVGAGYATAVFNRYGFTPLYPGVHAIIEAGKCHRHFGTAQ